MEPPGVAFTTSVYVGIEMPIVEELVDDWIRVFAVCACAVTV
jgi:hypothetical protein